MHNETIVIDRLVSSYSNLYVLVLSTLGNKLCTYSRKLHTVWHVGMQYIWVYKYIAICWKANLGNLTEISIKTCSYDV